MCLGFLETRARESPGLHCRLPLHSGGIVRCTPLYLVRGGITLILMLYISMNAIVMLKLCRRGYPRRFFGALRGLHGSPASRQAAEV